MKVCKEFAEYIEFYDDSLDKYTAFNIITKHLTLSILNYLVEQKLNFKIEYKKTSKDKIHGPVDSAVILITNHKYFKHILIRQIPDCAVKSYDTCTCTFPGVVIDIYYKSHSDHLKMTTDLDTFDWSQIPRFTDRATHRSREVAEEVSYPPSIDTFFKSSSFISTNPKTLKKFTRKLIKMLTKSYESVDFEHPNRLRYLNMQ